MRVRPGRFHSDARGSVTMFFGLSIVPLVLAAGVVIDYSSLASARSRLQRATDEAALAGVNAMSSSAALTAAREQAASTAATQVLNAEAPGSVGTVTPSATNNAVSVSATLSNKLYFGGVIGKGTSTVSAAATAKYTAKPSPVCLLSTAATGAGITFAGSGSFVGKDCVVWSNSPSKINSMQFQGSASVTAKTICANGNVTRIGSNQVTPAPQTSCGTMPDPLASWVPPPTPASCKPLGEVATSGAYTLDPGYYCGTVTIKAGSVTLNPGAYFMDGAWTIQSNSTVNGTGVQFVALPNGVLTVTAGTDLNVTAPADSSGKRVLLGQSGNVSFVSHTFTGNTMLNLGGSIHVPTQQVFVKGNAAVVLNVPNSTIVANMINVGGSGRIEFTAVDSSIAPPPYSERTVQLTQ